MAGVANLLQPLYTTCRESAVRERHGLEAAGPASGGGEWKTCTESGGSFH